MVKNNRILQITAGAVLCLSQVTGYAQNIIYQYSGPINGYTDVDLAPSGGDGGIETTFGTLNETFTFNPVAQTLEGVGTVTVSPASGSSEMYPYNLGGPNTPVGTVNLTVGDGGGTFSFDTGPATAFAAPGGGVYAFNEDILIPISGSGIYNGNAFSGNWFLDESIVTQISAAGPTSAMINEFQDGGSDFGEGNVPAGLQTGGGGDNTSYSHWELDTVTVSAVPEASTTQLLLMAGGALLTLRLVGVKL